MNEAPATPIHRSFLPQSGYTWLVMLACFGIFFLVQSSMVRSTHSDSRLNLITAQAILEKGTMRLDAYRKHPQAEAELVNAWYVQYDGHDYNFFPPGTSIAALPFVGLSLLLGKNMVFQDDDSVLQVQLAGLSLILVFLLLLRLARYWLPDIPALGLTLLFVLGTMIISTGATGLWTHDILLIHVAWVMLMFTRWQRERRPIQGWQLACALFMIWASRPSGLIFGLLAIAWILWQVREHRVRLSLWGAAGLLLFLGFNLLTIHRLLPAYYDPANRVVNPEYFATVLNLMVGPSRGLWLYCPFLLFILYGFFVKEVRRNPVWIMGVAWYGALALLIPRYLEWAGGWSLGPRLLMDALPGMFAALVITLRHFQEGPLPQRFLPVFQYTFAALLLYGVWLHTYRGLFSYDLTNWNMYMMTDQGNPDAYWDWKNPQFVATLGSNTRAQDHYMTRLRIQEFDRAVPPGEWLYLSGSSAMLAVTIPELVKAGQLQHNSRGSLPEMQAAKVTSFFVPYWEHANLLKAKNITLKGYPHDGGFGAWVADLKPGYTALVAVKDEATTGLSVASADSLTARGSKLKQLSYRGSWAAVLQRDTVLAENLSNTQAVTLNWGPWQLISAGHDAGNRSILRLNGTEHSPNLRGINYVLLDEAGNIAGKGCFDTFLQDAPSLYQAFWNEPPTP